MEKNSCFKTMSYLHFCILLLAYYTFFQCVLKLALKTLLHQKKYAFCSISSYAGIY